MAARLNPVTGVLEEDDEQTGEAETRAAAAGLSPQPLALGITPAPLDFGGPPTPIDQLASATAPQQPEPEPEARAAAQDTGAANKPAPQRDAMFSKANPAIGLKVLDSKKTTTTETKVSPEERALVAKRDKLDAAAVERGRLEALTEESKRREAESAAFRETQDAAERKQAEAEAAARVQERLQEKTTEFDAASEEAKKTELKGFWRDKTTGDRILAGLSVFFGALGAGLQGSNRNLALETIEKAIDRDIDLQKAMMAKKIETAARLGADVEKLRDRAEVATAAARAAGRELTAAETRRRAAMAGTDSAQADGERAAAALEANALKIKQDFLESTRTRVVTEEQQNTTRANRAGALGGAAKQLDAVLDLDGNVVGKPRSAIEGKKLREAQSAAVGIGESLGRLKDHVLTHGRTILPGDAKSERDSLISDATSYLTTMFNTGVLNAGEYERYKGQLNTSLLRGGDATAKGLDVMLTGLRSRYNAMLRGQAVAPDGKPIEVGKAGPAAAPARAAKPTAKQQAEIQTWLNSADAKKDPQKAARVREKLRLMMGG